MTMLPNLDTLPAEVRQSTRAVVWKFQTRDGKVTKVPYRADRPNAKAAVDQPETWAAFDSAFDSVADGKADGVGIVLGAGLVGVDLDGVRDPQSGQIADHAQAMITALDSYTEVSPSGRGVHVLVHGALPPGRRKRNGVEMYADGRYFTISGQHVTGTPLTIHERTDVLERLHAQAFPPAPERPPSKAPEPAAVGGLSDPQLLARAMTVSNGARFAALWSGDTSAYDGDDSAADLALCNLLAFWTGRDAGRIDGLFRQSALMREKWTSRRGQTTYGALTIQKAIADCREIYQPAITLERQAPPAPAHAGLAPDWHRDIPPPLSDAPDPSDQPSGAPPARRLVFHHAHEVMRQPPPPAVIADVALVGCVTVLVSESGAGKTFAMFSMDAAVSAGTPWHGRATQQGSTAHVSFEGDALGKRLAALHTVKGCPLEHVYTVRASEPLSPRLRLDVESPSPGEVDLIAALADLRAELAADGKPPIRLITIDTARASMTGSEDGSAEVSAYMRACRRILATVPEAAMVILHHSGWQDGDGGKKRERGSSAWRGNCDIALYLEATKTEAGTDVALTLKALKARDERPGDLHLIRRVVEFQYLGKTVQSCVIERDSQTREDRERQARADKAQTERQADLRILRHMWARPDASTSHDKIRAALNVNKQAVGAAISRLILEELLLPPERQRAPYGVTAKGREALGVVPDA